MIPCIRDIFSLAQLTIVAASGDGAHSGLPGIGQTGRPAEKPFEVHGLSLLPVAPSFNALMSKSAWRTRGWTFEEQVFSRKMLYVFPEEVIFSCSEGIYRESTGSHCEPGGAGSRWGDGGVVPPSVPALLSAKVNRGNQPVSLSAREFVQSVEEYTSRELMFEEDRIKAFAGLLAASDTTADVTQNTQVLLHGHPLCFFEIALTWTPIQASKRRLNLKGTAVAPSWSWASAGFQVHFLDDGEPQSLSRWFEHREFRSLDVLGLPKLPVADDITSIFSDPSVALRTRNALWDRMPWEATIPVSRNDTKRLPTLHLLTIVFESLVKPTEDEGVWSMPGSGATIVESLPPQSSKATEQRSMLALVAGGSRMYFLWLKPQSETGVFCRRGLLRVSHYSYDQLRSMARAGNVRWEYIRIV